MYYFILIKPNDFLKTATPADSLIYINDAILCVNVKGSMSIYTIFSIGREAGVAVCRQSLDVIGDVLYKPDQ
jgi:hypothetical protein